jgi:RNA polymerase sigma-70 factor (ECF subfamily)
MDDTERLFRTYHAPLVRYLTRRLGDRDWADEVAQETFLRALRQLKQGPLASERSWVFAVATNLVRDDARKAARQRRHLELLRSESRDEMVPAPDTTLEEQQERARHQALARRALEALTDRDRSALLMREEGLDYHEIAAALDVAFGSVGTTLARARRRLMEVYEALQRETPSDGAHDVAS